MSEYAICISEEEGTEIVKTLSLATGIWEEVEVVFRPCDDRHSIKWQRAYRYIRWIIPSELLRLEACELAVIMNQTIARIEKCGLGWQNVPDMWIPASIVLRMRSVLGWPMKGYDENGVIRPEILKEAEQ